MAYANNSLLICIHNIKIKQKDTGMVAIHAQVILLIISPAPAAPGKSESGQLAPKLSDYKTPLQDSNVLKSQGLTTSQKREHLTFLYYNVYML